MGRKSKYESVIPPNMEKIKEWIRDGVTEQDIAKNLGIGLTTWKRWKKQTDEFQSIVVRERRPRVEELENTMFRLATGYTETVRSAMKVRDPGGGEHIEFFDQVIVHEPNFNALRFLLTNWSDKYANDPAMIRQREKEFEHKKKIDELTNW